MLAHKLYETGDDDAPKVILDGNGEVVLALCRVCHQGEADLEDFCPGPKKKLRVYLASPTGFSPEGAGYRQRVKDRLTALGHTVVDPWDRDYSDLFEEAKRYDCYEHRVRFNKVIGINIGTFNRCDLLSSDVVLGILDGTEPDSGTVGEVCYGAGRGKVVYGLRTDVRDSGDLAGLPINLQVLDFIENSGGTLFRRIEDIVL